MLSSEQIRNPIKIVTQMTYASFMRHVHYMLSSKDFVYYEHFIPSATENVRATP